MRRVCVWGEGGQRLCAVQAAHARCVWACTHARTLACLGASCVWCARTLVCACVNVCACMWSWPCRSIGLHFDAFIHEMAGSSG